MHSFFLCYFSIVTLISHWFFRMLPICYHFPLLLAYHYWDFFTVVLVYCGMCLSLVCCNETWNCIVLLKIINDFSILFFLFGNEIHFVTWLALMVAIENVLLNIRKCSYNGIRKCSYNGFLGLHLSMSDDEYSEYLQ